MKGTNSYKGFETWFNGLRMAIKMHLYIFLIFLVLQIAITLTVTYYLQGHRYGAIGRYVLDSAKLFQPPDMNIVWPYVTYLFWNFVCVFLASSVIYFGYPFAIALFKGRSKRQLETKHLAGAGLVNAQDFVRQIGKREICLSGPSDCLSGRRRSTVSPSADPGRGRRSFSPR